MARFRYRMQSILDIKMKMETQAKQEFAAAKMALDEEHEKMQGLCDRKTGYEEKAKDLLKGGLHVQEITDNKNAILRMDEYIKEQQLRILVAEKQLEQARHRLQEVMKERKTHETLKEKAFEAFLQDENRSESKEIDELTSYIYGRKAGENNGETDRTTSN